MEAPSIVSRARTAFHSAAAKAERVFTDFKKSDSSIDRDCDSQLPKFERPDSSRVEGESKSYHDVRNANRRPETINVKQDWQERLKNIRIGKRGVQGPAKTDNFTMSFAIFDENLYLPIARDVSQSKGSGASLAEVSNVSNIDIIPPAFVIKRLAMGVETTGNIKSMKELLASSRDSSPIRERAGLSFSAMKSLVLRDKEDKFASEFGADEKVMSLISSLLDPGVHSPGRKTTSCLEAITNITSLPKDIHGAPVGIGVLNYEEEFVGGDSVVESGRAGIKGDRAGGQTRAQILLSMRAAAQLWRAAALASGRNFFWADLFPILIQSLLDLT